MECAGSVAMAVLGEKECYTALQSNVDCCCFARGLHLSRTFINGFTKGTAVKPSIVNKYSPTPAHCIAPHSSYFSFTNSKL